MLFKTNSEKTDEGLSIACGVCPRHNTTATDGVLLQFGVSCVDDFSDLHQLRIECPMIDTIRFNSAIDNCENLEKLIVVQAIKFDFVTSNRCNIQCNLANLDITATSGSNSTANTGLSLMIGALLFLMFMFFKNIH